jgi:hypothetical protein
MRPPRASGYFEGGQALREIVSTFVAAMHESPQIYFWRPPHGKHDPRNLVLLLAEFFTALRDAETLQWQGELSFAVLSSVEHTYLLTTDRVRYLIDINELRRRTWECRLGSGDRRLLAKHATFVAGFFLAAGRLDIEAYSVLRSELSTDFKMISEELAEALLLIREDVSPRSASARRLSTSGSA